MRFLGLSAVRCIPLLAACLVARAARAEQAAPPVEQAPVADPQPEPAPAAAAPNVAEELRALRERVDKQDEKIEALQAELDANASEEAEDVEPAKLSIYGFMDMGFQRSWLKPGSTTANFLNANASTFVLGNLNTYIDAQPVQGWRGLVELRFSNAPLGNVEALGGLGGGFKRTTTEQIDPNGASLNSSMWGGYSVIERAQIDWMPLQELNVRAGYFFTPFGIWNEDHGSPTLISTMLPQLISQKLLPIRQMGVMIYGKKLFGPWELGYMLTLSNGRQELSTFDFDDDKALGGRVFARNDGRPRWQFGLSFYEGDNNDKVIDLTAVSPTLQFDSHESFHYREWIAGADFSADIGDTRIRAEGLVRRVKYDTGKRDPIIPIFAQGAYNIDGYYSTAYLLGAHQLPWAGLEPFLFTEIIHGPFAQANNGLVLSGGANVHFTPSTMLKAQFSRGIFFNTGDATNLPPDPSQHDASVLFSRLVLVY